MYERHFGFKEKPFKLVPDPTFLFLGRTHREALAHLSYAVSQGEGFVEITGEVGTGKTTLCRAFLDGLDEQTSAAYIFNPRLDADQLLQTIIEELNVRCGADDIKGKIDALNDFLMECRRKRRRVVVLIDEAQGLKRDVLEQLRLLSNLETPRSKLLQIILVGQPELGDLLDAPELRQLGQRITLACHLSPLSRAETRSYIRHRIQIASHKPRNLFTHAAIGAVYRYSRGIPRLINIACDRGLLTAFSERRSKVGARLANSAIRELSRHHLTGQRKGRALALGLSLGLVVFLAVGTVGLHPWVERWVRSRQSERPAASMALRPTVRSIPETIPPKANKTHDGKPGVPKPAEEATTASAAHSASLPMATSEFQALLEDIDARATRQAALQAVLRHWETGTVEAHELEAIEETGVYFELGARQLGLRMQRLTTDLALLLALNLPAILKLETSDGASRFAAVESLGTREIILTLGDRRRTVAAESLEACWSGVVYLPWKNYYAIVGTVPRNAGPASVRALKMLLRDIGASDLRIDTDYDDSARRAVRAVQEKYGVTVDGKVGPMTKILLYNECDTLPVPRLGVSFTGALGKR